MTDLNTANLCEQIIRSQFGPLAGVSPPQSSSATRTSYTSFLAGRVSPFTPRQTAPPTNHPLLRAQVANGARRHPGAHSTQCALARAKRLGRRGARIQHGRLPHADAVRTVRLAGRAAVWEGGADPG